MADRYTVISADCHGGGQVDDYRDYLERSYLEDFDAWAATYAVPFEDLTGDDGPCNWDSDRRLADLEADGIVAEVIFPNTIPPFYPMPSLLAQPPPVTTGDDLEHRWAGLRAHNRWLADFCAATPGRRAGIAQVMLHDVDAAVAEVRRTHELGLTGGILLPGAPPGSGLPPLYAPDYEPLWSVCEELEMPINHHSGSAVPDLGDHDVSKVIFLLEVTWWAHRALWHLIFGGALERHPDLQVVFTEQGSSWVPETLGTLDYYYARMRAAAGSQEFEWGEPVRALSLTPSEYWDRQCHVGASFFRPTETHLRHVIGVDSIMWGSDYPHTEGSHPFSREALRISLHDVEPDEVARIVGGNAASLYRFDLDALAPIAARVGPTVDEIAVPLTDIPPAAMKCPAFQPQPLARTS